MFEVIFLFVLALVFIAFAVLQDLKSREIANWLNWSLIIFALGFRFFWGLFEGEAINLAFGKSLIFSLVFLGIPLLLFYLFEKASSSEIKIFKRKFSNAAIYDLLVSLFFIVVLLLSLLGGVSSWFSSGGLMFFYQGLIGFGIFFVLGNLFYYSKMFAGGDAKLMIALGAVLPFSLDFFFNLKIFVLFILCFLVVGAIYGLVATMFLSFRRWKEFRKEFSVQFRKNIWLICGILILAIVVLFLGRIDSMLQWLGVVLFILPYLYVYAKAVDEVCMVRNVAVSKLTEGDWLYKDVRVQGKVIKANWDGLEKKDIELLKSKKKVWIRYGIQFAPVFLISFLLLGIGLLVGLIERVWGLFF